MAKFWCPHPEHVWIPGAQLSVSGGTANFTIEAYGGQDEEILSIPEKDAAGLLPVDAEHEQGVDDICTLSTVTEGIMLHTSRVRYFQRQIYTRVAKTLIAVNPFADLPIYSAEFLQQYRAAADSLDEPPHIYGISQDALQGLRTSERDQAVLISGESGAGKTESAKLILSFVAECVRTGEGGVEERVLQTNPILEAFGNAMTVRNNNSSRFGKWLDLCCIEGPLRIQGCQLTSYLLETPRVTKQSEGERGFHVFYQMLQVRNNPPLAELNLGEVKSYNYLKQGQLKAPGIDDGECFVELRDCFFSLGFDATMQSEMYRILAAILNLGNIDIVADGHDASKLQSEDFAKQAADLLKVEPSAVNRALLFRQLVVGRDVTETPLRVEQAQAARDGMARLFYNRLFLWIFKRLNEYFKNEGNEGSGAERLLGVLDIAGFESFEQNSLEQLMINLSNEHLQQHFIKCIFKEEIDDSAREGIDMMGHIEFADNADVLTFIDGKGGCLDLLDETMTVPKATDMLFVQKVLKQHEKHSRLIAPKVAKCGYTIKHFAGNVTYTCDSWLEKNADRPPDSCGQLMASSELRVLQEIGEHMADEEAAALEAPSARGGAKRKAKSVSSGFRTSLKALILKISAADPHYVRCIKPNMLKVPGKFEAKMVMNQMILSGVLATVHIRQQGFAYRVPHRMFILTYRCIVEQLGKKKLPKVGAAADVSASQLKVQSEEIVELLPECLPSFGDLGSKMFAIGTTKVFIKLDAFKAIEDGRRYALGGVAAFVQRCMRGIIVRRDVKQRRELHNEIRDLLTEKNLRAVEPLQPAPGGAGRKSVGRVSTASAWGGDCIAERLGSPEEVQKVLFQLELQLKRAEAMGFRNGEVIQAERAMRRMQRELEAIEEMEKMKDSIDVMDIEKALAKVRGMNMLNTPAALALDERLEALRQQLPLLKAMKTALEAGADTDDSALKEVQTLVSDAELGQGSEKWLSQLEGPHLVAEIIRVIAEREEERRRIEEQRIAAEKAAEEARQRALEEEAKAEAARIEALKLEGEKRVAAEAAAKAEAQKAAVSKAQAATAEAAAESARSVQKHHDGGGDEAGGGGARSRRARTVTGLDLADKAQLKIGLKKAAQEYDAVMLEKLLRRAAEDGVKDDDDDDDDSDDENDSGVISRAETVFQSLQSEMFILGALEEARSKSLEADPPMLVLKQLENLSQQLCSMPGYEDEAEDVARSATAGLMKLRKNRCMSVFQSRDAEEAELASKVFERLSSYSGLKPVKGWCGHNPTAMAGDSSASMARRPSTLRQSSGKEEGKMLNHCKMCIYESLTLVPDESGIDEDDYEGGAILNFRNILVCMGDRPSQQCQRNASRAAILELARQDTHLRGEVYLQVMKQLTKNPMPSSSSRGWELLLRLCQQAPPDAELSEFMRYFITHEETESALGDSAGIAKACLMALDCKQQEAEETKQSEVEVDDLAAMAERVTQRLDEAAARLSIEVYQLNAVNAQQVQEIQRLNFEKGRQAADIANLSNKATLVANQLDQAVTRLASKKMADEAKFLSVKALLAAAGIAPNCMAAVEELEKQLFTKEEGGDEDGAAPQGAPSPVSVYATRRASDMNFAREQLQDLGETNAQVPRDGIPDALEAPTVAEAPAAGKGQGPPKGKGKDGKGKGPPPPAAAAAAEAAPAAPMAAAAVDLDGDGRADVIVVGVDKDGDGIPDVLETPAAAPKGKKGPPAKGKPTGKGPPPPAAEAAPIAAVAVDLDGDGRKDGDGVPDALEAPTPPGKGKKGPPPKGKGKGPPPPA